MINSIVSRNDIVFGSNGAGVGQGALDAPPTGIAEYDIPQGPNMQAVWWVPEDNIGDLIKFHHIELSVSGPNIHIKVGGSPPQGLLRIRVYIAMS